MMEEAKTFFVGLFGIKLLLIGWALPIHMIIFICVVSFLRISKAGVNV